jgi:uncharacterized damage-inducible protein DinB
VADLRTRRDALFNPDAFPNVAAVQLKWAEVEKEQHLMQHLANHSTYHRGQVGLMMRQLGAEPQATDFHVFLAEGV